MPANHDHPAERLEWSKYSLHGMTSGCAKLPSHTPFLGVEC